MPFTARTLGADFITISAHKIGGPKGAGALYIGPRVRNPRPLLAGGGQEGAVFNALLNSKSFQGVVRAAVLDVLRSPEGQALLRQAVRKELGK